MNIMNNISIENLKSIITKDNAEKVLIELGVPYKKNNIWGILHSNYNYNVYKEIFRKIAFGKSGKYDLEMLPSYIDNRDSKINEYHKKFPNDDKLEWVFQPDNFDNYRKDWTFGKITFDTFLKGVEKHSLVASIAELTSRITEITLILNDVEILPTLKNNGKVDYFRNGKPKDLKNAKSIGKGFIDEQIKKGNDPFDVISKTPETHIKWFYENQSSVRFGFEPRHFIVNTNEKIISTEDLINKLNNVNFDEEIEVSFTFGGKEYVTNAIITYI